MQMVPKIKLSAALEGTLPIEQPDGSKFYYVMVGENQWEVILASLRVQEAAEDLAIASAKLRTQIAERAS